MAVTLDTSERAVQTARLYAGVPPRGAEIIGTVARNGIVTGSLVRLANGVEVECPAGVLRNLPRPRGQKRIGRPILVRLPDDMLAAVDARATDAGVSRAEMIRRLLAPALEG